jgi:hypothetical protein
MNLQQYAGVIASKGLQEKAKPGLMKKNIFLAQKHYHGHERLIQDL